MTPLTPKVSVICAVYNHEKYLRQAIESVLAQTFPSWELLLWDDGSSDFSFQIAQEFSSKYPDRIFAFQHEFSDGRGRNRGQEATRNAAIAKARGEWVALLDSDDYYLPRKLDSLLAVVAGDDVGMVFGRARILADSTGQVIDAPMALQAPGPICFGDLVWDNFIFAGAVIFRRRFCESGFHFDSSFKTIGEYPLWLDIALQSKVVFINESVCVWRDHGANTGTKYELEGKRELARLMDRLVEQSVDSACLESKWRENIILAWYKRAYDVAAFALDNGSAVESRTWLRKWLAGPNNVSLREKMRALRDVKVLRYVPKAFVLYAIGAMGSTAIEVFSRAKRVRRRILKRVS